MFHSALNCAKVSEMARINPLAVWLEAVGESKNGFLKRIGCSTHTLYDFLAGVNKEYSARTLKRFEDGTGGEVTMRMMFDWLDETQKEQEKA